MFGFCSIRRFHVYCSQNDSWVTLVFFNKIRIYPLGNIKPVKPVKIKDSNSEFGSMSYYYYPNPYEMMKKANLYDKNDKNKKDKR